MPADEYTLSDIQYCSFLVLLVLNATYFPTFKWIYPALRRMSHTPPEIATRLHAMFQKSPSQAVEHLRTVLAETLDMVETRYPQLDTAYARYGLDQEPLVYDH